MEIGVDIVEILIDHEIDIIDTLILWIDLIVIIEDLNYVGIVKDYASKKCFYMLQGRGEEEKEVMIMILNNFILVKNLIDEFISSFILVKENIFHYSVFKDPKVQRCFTSSVFKNCVVRKICKYFNLSHPSKRTLKGEQRKNEYYVRLYTKWKYYKVI